MRHAVLKQILEATHYKTAAVWLSSISQTIQVKFTKHLRDWLVHMDTPVLADQQRLIKINCVGTGSSLEDLPGAMKDNYA